MSAVPYKKLVCLLWLAVCGWVLLGCALGVYR